MRLIKFRYYDKKNKTMRDWDYLRRYFMHTLDDNEDTEEYSPFMQFTGLTDKNKQEIYEGDILSNGEHINWIVIWDDGSFKVKLVNSYVIDNWILNNGKSMLREIVGNIYENPEHLEW